MGPVHWGSEWGKGTDGDCGRWKLTFTRVKTLSSSYVSMRGCSTRLPDFQFPWKRDWNWRMTPMFLKIGHAGHLLEPGGGRTVLCPIMCLPSPRKDCTPYSSVTACGGSVHPTNDVCLSWALGIIAALPCLHFSLHLSPSSLETTGVLEGNNMWNRAMAYDLWPPVCHAQVEPCGGTFWNCQHFECCKAD